MCQVVEESESESEAVECRFRCGQCAVVTVAVGHSGHSGQVKELPDPDWVNGSCNVGRLHIFLDSAAKNLWQSGAQKTL